jgi:hypothetical protein
MTTEGTMNHERAWVSLPSGRHLYLFAPNPQACANLDLAIGLSRTY